MEPPPLPDRESSAPRVPKRLLWTGACVGFLYGLFARAFFGFHYFQPAFGVMTIGFLFLVPFILGYVVVHVGEAKGRWSWPNRIFMPWLAAAACMAAAVCLLWEGLLCIVLGLPLFLVMTLLGSITAGLVNDHFRAGGQRRLMMACCLMIPFVVTPIENRFPQVSAIRTVSTQIEIHAGTRAIWDQIKSVQPIRREELRRTFSQRIGFPRPIAATLSREGIGGVRRATFEGNVVFIETVNAWEPGRRLAFSIRADTSAIPATTLDEHVTVGGPFFDVLNGEYRIESIAPGQAILHLSSQHRLSTHFNSYAGLWTEFLMRDIQDGILEVIKNRCERDVPAAATSVLAPISFTSTVGQTLEFIQAHAQLLQQDLPL